MIDKAPGQDMDSVIRETVNQNMPINPEEHQIDYKILQQIKDNDITKVKVFITAVSKKIIKSYIDILLELGLKPLSVDIPANSTAKFFNREIKVLENESWYKKQMLNKGNNDTFAVLDFGSETTIVNILRDRVLEFNKVILIGSSNLEGAMSSNMGIKLDEAERFKKMYGMVLNDMNTSDQQEKIYRNIKDIIDKIIVQIHQCFEFYDKRCFGAKIGKVYIIGGGSLLKGLREYLEEVLAVPVYPVGLLSIDGVKINQGLDRDRLNFLINSVGITL
jgi:type IV pilus assembly protein PilM